MNKRTAKDLAVTVVFIATFVFATFKAYTHHHDPTAGVVMIVIGSIGLFWILLSLFRKPN